jgi:serine phosphatase RsbU (regulator of sigma subunit)/putative methionine-R-sulfoxide reductase with GAF domain/anti-sigma regulatory factor (Ser/Thr protein kinase)
VPTDESVLAALQRVTDAALAFLSEDDLLTELLERTSEVLHSDTAAILLLDEANGVLRARAAKGIEEEVEQRVQIPIGKGFAGRVAAQRRAISIDDVDHADVLNPILREKGIRSLLGVPLLIQGRVLGVMHVGSLTPRIFTDDDRDLLQYAADRAALAIEHAQLYTRERAARAQLEALQRVTDAALAYLPQELLLKELLERTSEILHSDTAAILMLDEANGVLRARAAKGIEEEVEQGVQIPIGKGFAGRVAAQRRAITIDDVDHADVLNPILREKGIRSLLGVPLLIEGRVLGVMHVGSLTPRVFTDDDRDLLQHAADRAALAIEHAQLFEQRRLAEVLQHRLLPQRLTGIPGLELASRYLPASESVGGDWYDAFALAPGRIALAVGDVVGHGLAPAAVMAQLRTALRAYAVDGHPPADVVERVNRLMWALGPNAMTTLVYLVLDPVRDTFDMVNAGHPPALVIEPDGEASYLPPQGGVALGATPVARYRCDTYPFAVGSTVVLYTDGLVEERGASIDAGLERLRALSAGAGGPEELCEAIVDRLVPEAPADDIAIIAARVPPLPEELHGRWRAEKESLADVRALLRRWLHAQGATEDEAYDIVVASQEACANAVEHAYAPGGRAFEVEASYREGRVRVVVRDNGRWRPPRGDNRGRGLPLMRALMERVDITHADAGTVVVLERRLGRQAA